MRLPRSRKILFLFVGEWTNDDEERDEVHEDLFVGLKPALLESWK